MLVNEEEKRRIIDLHFSQNYALANGEQGDFAQHEQDRVIPNVKAYRLKILLEVAAELNLPGPQVQQFYIEYLNMRQMHKLVTPEQIMRLIRMSDSIQTFQEKLEQS